MTDYSTSANWRRPSQPLDFRFGGKTPTATETNLRDLLLAHLQSAAAVVRNAETLAGETTGAPWDQWREHIAILAEHVERTDVLIRTSPL